MSIGPTANKCAALIGISSLPSEFGKRWCKSAFLASLAIVTTGRSPSEKGCFRMRSDELQVFVLFYSGYEATVGWDGGSIGLSNDWKYLLLAHTAFSRLP
jgi:hypothetical protein